MIYTAADTSGFPLWLIKQKRTKVILLIFKQKQDKMWWYWLSRINFTCISLSSCCQCPCWCVEAPLLEMRLDRAWQQCFVHVWLNVGLLERYEISNCVCLTSPRSVALYIRRDERHIIILLQPHDKEEVGEWRKRANRQTANSYRFLFILYSNVHHHLFGLKSVDANRPVEISAADKQML